VTGAPLIVAEDVAQRFGDRTVFEHVRFDVRAGEIFVILGGSGCGKSTLMRQMIGLLPPSEGRMMVLGHDMREPDAGVLTRIGVMFQGGALFGSKTLLENVMLPLEMHTDLPRAAREDLAAVKLGLVGLGDAANLQPAEISGGMAKRCGIARALALDPPLLFLDEPAAGLDPVTSAGLDQLILDLRAQLGLSFVVVSHELTSILTIGDRCIMLDKAARGVIATGNPRQLRDESADTRVQAFFRRSLVSNG
jgi:phospholipid/cholesterol/gamma-HCH transport system ATP-binding protein